MCISNLMDIIATFIAATALIMSIIFSFLQQKHNKNSVRPIASIDFYDREDYISVRIKNNGSGPMIIKEVVNTRHIDYNNSEKADNLFKLMPRINQNWCDYTTELKNRSLSVKDSIALIELIPINDNIKKQVRSALSDITIVVNYEDIYGQSFSTTRSCEFFGRAL